MQRCFRAGAEWCREIQRFSIGVEMFRCRGVEVQKAEEPNPAEVLRFCRG